MEHATDPAAEQSGADLPRSSSHDVDVRVRRAPKYGVFLLIGAIVGALVAWLLSAIQPPGVDDAGQPVDTTGVLGLALVSGVVLGVAAGAVVALIIDRALARRTRTMVAEQFDWEPAAPVEPQLDDNQPQEPDRRSGS